MRPACMSRVRAIVAQIVLFVIEGKMFINRKNVYMLARVQF